MHHHLFAVAVAATMLFWSPTATEAACCDQKPAKHTHSCCAGHHPDGTPTVVERLLENDPQLNPAPPVRQLAEVWFQRPVIVGKAILQGHYVLEHDNDRQARGEPCTHIYAFNDRDRPVAAFHCTHLERDRAHDNRVVLITDPVTGMQKLTEFQFAGETAAHGYPAVR